MHVSAGGEKELDNGTLRAPMCNCDAMLWSGVETRAYRTALSICSVAPFYAGAFVLSLVALPFASSSRMARPLRMCTMTEWEC